ncbi:MAG: hypothetical protein KatS3mg131_3608 [Candidatus Tectimicrobiota bacterium]|nr:MAG: hypothetical protein KatS3mg131_3608 [Candidatus Tectomicrobia bacterium]
MALREKVRLPLMATALLSLLAALWAGLLRLGWPLPLASTSLPAGHGPLLVGGFLGTLIGVERAVALGKAWAYGAAACSALGALALLVGLPAAPLLTLGSAGLVAELVWLLRRQPGLAMATMALGALAWLVGNALWLWGWPLFRVVPWWLGFLVLTIAGERLELSRLLALPGSARLAFAAAVGLILLGLLLSLGQAAAGVRLLGVGLLALAVWLWRYDVARRTVRQQGLTRYIALCLLSGYAWLGLGGALALYAGAVAAGPRYDAVLHAVFVGFVFAMIFGHALVIFPAVLGRPLPYGPHFFAPLVLLHASLLLRLASDLGGWGAGRQWGGLGNALAIAGFLGLVGQAVRRGGRLTPARLRR